MSDQSCSDLVNSLWGFAVQGTQRSLRDFQRLAGHLNWALNVYPLLCPGLSALYAKTAGKLEQKALIWVNRDIVWELSWVAQHLIASDGVYFLKTLAWDFHHMAQATLAVYTDASSIGVETQFSTGWHWPILWLMTTGLHSTTSPSCVE